MLNDVKAIIFRKQEYENLILTVEINLKKNCQNKFENNG